MDADDPTGLERALSGLDPAALPDGQAVLLLRLRSVAARDLGRADEALELLADAARRAPADPGLAFQTGVLLEEAGRAEEAADAFVRAGTEADADPPRALAALRRLYLWDRPAEALGALQPLFRGLAGAGAAGGRHPEPRGLPAFVDLACHHALFARMEGRPDRIEELAAWATRTLRHEGVEEACRLAVAFARGSREAYGDWLGGWAVGAVEGAAASGGGIAWALHRARDARRIGDALAHLDRAPLGDGAPGWLEDLRTFGRAEALHRFGMEDDEARWRRKLLLAQPLLFEPEHVVRFDLFGYQERLKALWRDARVRGPGRRASPG